MEKLLLIRRFSASQAASHIEAALDGVAPLDGGGVVDVTEAIGAVSLVLLLAIVLLASWVSDSELGLI